MSIYSTIRDYLSVGKIAFGYSFKFVKWKSIVLIIIACVLAIFPYFNSFVLGNLVDQLVNNGNNLMNILIPLLFYALILAIPNLLESIRLYFNKIWYFDMNLKMEMMVFKKRLELDIEKYEDPSFQNLMQRAFKNSFWPLFDLCSGQFDLIRHVIAFTFGTFIVLKFGIVVYLILMISALPGLLTQFKYGNGNWNIWKVDSPNQRKMVYLKRFFSTKHNVVETKLLQSGQLLLEWIHSILSNFQSKQSKLEKQNLGFSFLSEIISLAGFVTTTYLIAVQELNTTGSVGNLVFALGVIATVRQSTAVLLLGIAKSYEHQLTVQDILQVLNQESKFSNNATKNQLTHQIDRPPTIEFRSVSFKYPISNKWSLRNINLTINPGEKIGLVGNNGAGKSTLVKLLCRIYDPTEGEILINGKNLKSINLQEWWSYLGVMMQDYSNYDLQLDDSIAIGRTNVEKSLENVKKAAKISLSDTFIEKWPDKYLQSIGLEFGGVEPSKGQRQKLSLAKIIYRNPLIMILDEPTASIDAESEGEILDNLKRLPNSMSLLLITHNFSTIKECDQIVFFENGEIIELGSHQSLLDKNKQYAAIYQYQASKFN